MRLSQSPRPELKIVRPLAQLIVGLALAALVLHFAFDWMVLSASRGASDWTSFDRPEWLKHTDPGENRNPRMPMVPALKERMREAPMSKAQAIALLGPPTYEQDSSLYYAVGWWGSMDPNSFVVEILEDGQVGRLRVVQH